MSNLQLLTSNFEALKMFDDESIVKFNVRVLDIANELFSLGEKFLDIELVRKVLHFLPQRFSIKVKAIEEENGLMNCLALYGHLNCDSKQKHGIALQSVSKDVP